MSACCTFYRQVISNSCSWFHIQVMRCNLLLFFALSFFTCLTPLSFSSDISPPGNFPKPHPMSHTLLSCPWNSRLEASICHVWLHKLIENKDFFNGHFLFIRVCLCPSPCLTCSFSSVVFVDFNWRMGRVRSSVRPTRELDVPGTSNVFWVP